MLSINAEIKGRININVVRVTISKYMKYYCKEHEKKFVCRLQPAKVFL